MGAVFEKVLSGAGKGKPDEGEGGKQPGVCELKKCLLS